MLQVAGLTKFFDNREIFSGFDLVLPLGKFQVLLGPSGCGKSTLLDALTGVIVPDDGAISWQDTPHKHLGNVAAYMQQKDLLLPWFSLMDNALLPARTGHSTRARAQDRAGGRGLAAARRQAARLFQRLGLAGYEDHRPSQVSGGMRQRCALVRTLMFNRELILLDEPLSALDAITRRRLQSMLLLLQTEFSKTILMITHDVDEALVLADEICLLGKMPMGITHRFSLDRPKPRQFDDPVLLDLKARILSKLEGDA